MVGVRSWEDGGFISLGCGIMGGLGVEHEPQREEAAAGEGTLEGQRTCP